MNYITYFTHYLKPPQIFQRRFTEDLPQDEESGSLYGTGRRVALIVLPFAALYQPAGHMLSLGMNSVRSVTQFSDMINQAQNGCALPALLAMGKTTLAIMMLSACLFNFKLGLFANAFTDSFSALAKAASLSAQGEHRQALKELALASTTILHLALLLNGSLEIALALLLCQAMVAFCESYSEERWPEAIAKAALGLIYLRQSHWQYKLIGYKNGLIKDLKELILRIEKGRKGAHLLHDELNDMESAHSRHDAQLDDGMGHTYDLGAYFNLRGEGVVKGMNIQLKKEEHNGREVFALEFIPKQPEESVLGNFKAAEIRLSQPI